MLPRVAVLVRVPPELRDPLLSEIVRHEQARGMLLSFPAGKPRQRAAGPIGAHHLVGDYDAWSLIARAERIIAAPDDELALLAAASERHVHDAATGLSVDLQEARHRFVQAVDAFNYVDPFDGREIDVVGWISILARWRVEIDSNRSIASVAGIRRWKSHTLRQLLWSDQSPTLGSSKVAGTPIGKSIALWPSRAPRGLLQHAADASVDITRIEDGFIRSLGLGTLLVPPCSIVVDRLGIYYDPSQSSDLEQILSDTVFSPALLRRADALIRALVQGGVTKYAAGAAAAIALPAASRRILVPGQVEDDQSVRLGAAGVVGNLDLLRRARREQHHRGLSLSRASIPAQAGF
ncbi:capsular polysaccharide export protein, LipB/KpsS family [Sphingomonas sp. PB4P5]|uniref:capsular polysaccharide export protein, LipB/KpsS family n=1 Tax=Parasphingomonas puruogangriensis TaxID=3096155 RepID=UPI002FC7AF9A